MSVSESSTNWRISSIMVSAFSLGSGTRGRVGLARVPRCYVAKGGLAAHELPGGRTRQLLDHVQPPRPLVRGKPGRDLVFHGRQLSSLGEHQERLDRVIMDHNHVGALWERGERVLDLGQVHLQAAD